MSVITVTRVRRGLPSRGRRPHSATVYSTTSGTLGSFPAWRPMTWREQLTTAYRLRHDVDMSDHRHEVSLDGRQLPAGGGHFTFVGRLDIALRIHDPEEIVRRNPPSLLDIALTYVTDQLRPLTRQYGIEETGLAENEIAKAFEAEVPLPEGITVLAVAARLEPDEKAAAYLRQKYDSERRLIVDLAKHEQRLTRIRQRGELERAKRQVAFDLAEQERQQMQDRVIDSDEILRRHLARHPDDTEGAMRLYHEHRKALLQRQEIYNEHSDKLFRLMLKRGDLEADDMKSLLDRIIPLPPAENRDPGAG